MRWFDHIYVINLAKRLDRLLRVEEEFKTIGETFERFLAVDGDEEKIPYKPANIDGWNNNSAALLETTIKVIQDAKKKKYKSVLICEDDVFFSATAKQDLERLQLPEDGSWDMFFFGAIHQFPPTHMGGHILKLKRSFCCHCYAVHERVYDDYLRLLEARDRPIDWITTDFFQPHGRCFSPAKGIAFQKPDYSNIRKEKVNYLIR